MFNLIKKFMIFFFLILPVWGCGGSSSVSPTSGECNYTEILRSRNTVPTYDSSTGTLSMDMLCIGGKLYYNVMLPVANTSEFSTSSTPIDEKEQTCLTMSMNSLNQYISGNDLLATFEPGQYNEAACYAYYQCDNFDPTSSFIDSVNANAPSSKNLVDCTGVDYSAIEAELPEWTTSVKSIVLN